MKNLLLSFLILLFSINLKAQFIAKLEVKEPIEGVCDQNEVYSLFPSFDGQVEAVCPISEDEILDRLNKEVTFLKENPKFKGKGMIGLIINCKGEVVKCEMDNKTSSKELDKQIEDVFNSLGKWKAGTLNGKKVDSSMLFSFKIKKGKIKFK